MEERTVRNDFEKVEGNGSVVYKRNEPTPKLKLSSYEAEDLKNGFIFASRYTIMMQYYISKNWEELECLAKQLDKTKYPKRRVEDLILYWAECCTGKAEYYTRKSNNFKDFISRVESGEINLKEEPTK